MYQLYVLFESASGYVLFRTTEFEEIAMFLPQVQRRILDVSKFRSILFLVAFHPFKAGSEALENMKCVAEGKLHMDLQLFIESNVPKSKKSKQSVVLGLQDPTLAAAITKSLNITCLTTGVVPEIIRGIRFHLHTFLKGYKDPDNLIKGQLRLAHNFSREKVNFDVENFDTLILHVTSMLDVMQKDINTLTSRVRKWYSLHFPELVKLVPDNESYIKCVKALRDRRNLSHDVKETLSLILSNDQTVDAILKSSSNSMGMQISQEDVKNVLIFAEQILSLIDQRNKIARYLKSKMFRLCPNLTEVLGESDGAHLISLAGGLSNLSKLTSSSVQVIGAKRCLFRSLKSNKAISFVGNPGKGCRNTARKCVRAARMDYFGGATTDTS